MVLLNNQHISVLVVIVVNRVTCVEFITYVKY